MKLDASDIEAFRPLIQQVVRETLALLRPVAATPALEVFTEQEAADLLRMEKKQLADQRRLGRIGFSRGPRRTVRYTRTHIDTYLAGLPPDKQ